MLRTKKDKEEEVQQQIRTTMDQKLILYCVLYWKLYMATNRICFLSATPMYSGHEYWSVFLPKLIKMLQYLVLENTVLSNICTNWLMCKEAVFDWKTILLCLYCLFPWVQLWNPNLVSECTLWTQKFSKSRNKKEEKRTSNLYGCVLEGQQKQL